MAKATIHAVLGRMDVEGTPGTVFQPLGWMMDPGRWEAARRVWASRYRRSAHYLSVPPAMRASRLEEAVENCTTVYLTTDYEKAGVTDEQFARAVLRAGRWMERAGWILPQTGDAPRRRRERKWYPYNRGENSRSPSPAAIAHAARFSREDRAALTGEGCDDAPGPIVAVAGGPSGRGPTDGTMERTETVVREWVTPDSDGNLDIHTEIETGWRMNRGRGRAETLPACRVNGGTPAPLARFIRQAMPIGQAWRADADNPGPVCNRETCRPIDPAGVLWVRDAGERHRLVACR